MRTFLAGLRVGGFPVELQAAEEVVTAQGVVHGALALQAGVALVWAAGLAFVDDVVVLVVPLVGGAVAVFPVVAVVEDALEVDFVVGVDFPVESEGVALALAGDVVLAHLVFVDVHVVVVIALVGHLDVVAAGGVVLVGGGQHEAQLVVEEAVAVAEAEVQAQRVAHPVVAAADGGGEEAARGRVFGDEVDGAADGVGVHVGGDHLVDLDGLNHVGGNEVELYITRLALGRGDAAAVDGDGGEVGARAAHLAEAGLALVVLHVDARDALQRIADVRVGELAHLVGRHDVLVAEVVFLHTL